MVGLAGKRITARFYQTEAGKQPARDWVLGLDAGDRKIVGKDIATVEFGWPIGMPVSRSVGNKGLREVRSTLRKGRVEARVIFGIDGNEMILLHGHEKSPRSRIWTSRRRSNVGRTIASGSRIMKSKRAKKPVGETFESLMQDLGIRDEVYETATKRVLAWQLEQVRKANGLTKRAMAEAMHTSRSHLDRVLDPDNVEVTLATLQRAARAVGKRLKVELVDAA
jgi:hypothetical protein